MPVSGLNTLLRQGSAKAIQILVVIGLITATTGRARRYLRVSSEFHRLGVASIMLLIVPLVIPSVSASYGLLRAFEQAMFVLAPFLALGSVSLFDRLRGCEVVASAIALTFYLSLSGVVPQFLGGYPPQLHLNNSGQYYDIYLVHTQEVRAIDWLKTRLKGEPSNIQSEVETDRYTFNRVRTYSGLSQLNDVYPTLIRVHSFVFLGYATVLTGRTTVSLGGDLVTYLYPSGFLDATKDLIYSNGGAEVYG